MGAAGIGGNSDLMGHCPTLTIRGMKTFIAGLMALAGVGLAQAEIKTEMPFSMNRALRRGKEKIQTPNKLQAPMGVMNCVAPGYFGAFLAFRQCVEPMLVFEGWCLFGVWILELGVSARVQCRTGLYHYRLVRD